MTSNGYTPFKIGVPLQKKCIYSVHFRSYCVHDGLTVGGAIVKEDIQDCIISEVSETINAGQGYPLQISERGKKKIILSRKPKSSTLLLLSYYLAYS